MTHYREPEYRLPSYVTESLYVLEGLIEEADAVFAAFWARADAIAQLERNAR